MSRPRKSERNRATFSALAIVIVAATRVVIEGVLGEPIKIRSGGPVRTVSKLDAMLQTQLASALGGDPKAALAVFKLGRKAGLFSQAKPTNHMIIYPPGTDEERMILKAFHAEQGANEESEDEPDEIGQSALGTKAQ